MPIVELVKDSQVKALPAPHPSGKPVLFFAEDMPGFAVLVSGVGATKTYVAQRDLPGGRSRRVKIARCNFLPLKEARQRAAQMLLRIEAGDDPKAAKKVLARGAVTLQKVFADYLVDNPNLRPASVRNYRAYLRHLEDWMDQPIKTIDRDAVERRHRQIAKEVAGRGRGSIGAGSANSAMRVLRILWNHAADHPERYGVIPANPVRLGKAWLPEPRREGRVNDGDLAKFYSGIMALKNDIGRNFLTMLLFTGLRLTEAAS
jgi:Arm DNA-binding domain